ncbi:hypothetical protein K503DRAFT_787545 [Rhizopogon vinicolor AM-OR11-026]|uniref:Uncharacterized protein n=1 Tax=Rhizopogon vinicolor AM-OR11-026 TaxID=1314800 RepID=A0A1B7MH18_9AGAM|nr:hypothetical protein K503DRAFT_787545 [Rhizopogon vinicolor AM-OR11-026]
MFQAASTAGFEELDGQSDDKPIHLDSIAREMFELFLEHTFGSASQRPNFVISRIQANPHRFHPSQLITLAIKYHIHDIFPPAFKRLVDTPIIQLTAHHRELLGTTVFTTFVYVQAALEQHRRIVAAEEPRILVHASDCQEPAGCNEDWHAIWWNGMGRFLLDGRNPQPYCEAVKRFKDMEFGRVSRGCKELMFKIIDQGAAFNHADQFIEEACNRLVEQLIFDTSTST